MMQSLKSGMKSLGLAAVGFLSVEKMLGRGAKFWSLGGRVGGMKFKAERKVALWKGLVNGLVLVWPMME